MRREEAIKGAVAQRELLRCLKDCGDIKLFQVWRIEKGDCFAILNA